ncbi:cyclin-D1-binding protein 1 homolog isoform X2 [Hyalella azteca]|nr:cyclin-D1-binding protein 1 homolog isoform X2 [Hyalella azteca]
MPLDESTKQILMLVRFLPLACGRELKKCVTTASIALLQSLSRLLQLAEDHNTPALETAYTQLTGQTWGECKAIQSLPCNNVHAVLRALRLELDVVDDAYREITESLEGDGKGWNVLKMPRMDADEDSDTEESDSEAIGWSPEDKLKLDCFVKVAKAVKLLYKRCLEVLDSRTKETNPDVFSDNNRQLWATTDDLRQSTKSLPELLDDLVLSMYPPVNWDVLVKNSHLVMDVCEAALSVLLRRQLATEEHLQSLQFLSTALAHTRRKVDTTAAHG